MTTLGKTSRNRATWCKRRKRPGGGVSLMIAALLASMTHRAAAAFGENKCATTATNPWLQYSGCADCLTIHGEILPGDEGSLNRGITCFCENDTWYKSIDNAFPLQTLAILADWRDSYLLSDDNDAILHYKLFSAESDTVRDSKLSSFDDWVSLERDQNTQLIDLSSNTENYNYIALWAQCTKQVSVNLGQYSDEHGFYYWSSAAQTSLTYAVTSYPYYTYQQQWQCRPKPIYDTYCYKEPLLKPDLLSGDSSEPLNSILRPGPFTTNCNISQLLGQSQLPNQECTNQIASSVEQTLYWQVPDENSPLKNVVSVHMVPGADYNPSKVTGLLRLTDNELNVTLQRGVTQWNWFDDQNGNDVQNGNELSFNDINDNDVQDAGEHTIRNFDNSAAETIEGIETRQQISNVDISGDSFWTQEIYQLEIELVNASPQQSYAAGFFLLTADDEALVDACAEDVLVFDTSEVTALLYEVGYHTLVDGTPNSLTLDTLVLLSSTAGFSCQQFYTFSLSDGGTPGYPGYDVAQFQDVSVDPATGVLTTRLHSSVVDTAESTASTEFIVKVELIKSDGITPIQDTDGNTVSAEITIPYKINKCKFTLTSWPATKSYQTRQNLATLSQPSYNQDSPELCSNSVIMIQIFDSADVLLSTFDASSANPTLLDATISGLVISQWQVTFEPAADALTHPFHSVFKIRYTLTMGNQITNQGLPGTTYQTHTDFTETTVTYVDNCNDPGQSTITFASINDMTTSVLRPVSETTYDLSQAISDTATLNLRAPDNTQNQIMCGDFIIIEMEVEKQTGVTSATTFIQLSHDFQANIDGADLAATYTNMVTVEPIQNEHIGTYAVTVKVYYKDYGKVDVFKDQSFTVEVFPCQVLEIHNTEYSAADGNTVPEVMDLDLFPSLTDSKVNYSIAGQSLQADGLEHNEVFIILASSATTFSVTNYKYYPTCDFSAQYTIENGGVPTRIEDDPDIIDEASSFTDFWTESSNTFVALSDVDQAANKAVSPIYSLSLKSEEPLDGGGYSFEVSVKIITDPDDSASAPPVGITDFTRYFNIYADNPCIATTVLKSTDLEEPMRRYTILGIGGTVEIADFTDQVSMDKEENQPHRGYITCGERLHEFREYEKDANGDGMYGTEFYDSGKLVPYMTLTDLGATLNIEYRTSTKSLAGEHELVLYTWLADYALFLGVKPNLANDETRMFITFFQLKTNMAMDDVEYTLQSGVYYINIPELLFNPELHHSENEETGANGALMVCQIFTKEKNTQYTMIDPDLGTLIHLGGNEWELLILATDVKFMLTKSILVKFVGQDYIDGESFETDFAIQVNPPPATNIFGLPKPFFILNGYEPQYDLNFGQAWSIELPPGGHEDSEVIVTYRSVQLGEAAKFVQHDKVNDLLQIEEGAIKDTDTGSYSIKLQLQASNGVYSEYYLLIINVLEKEVSVEEAEAAAGDVSLFSNNFFGNLLSQRSKDVSFLEIDPSLNIKMPTASLTKVTAYGEIQIKFSNPMSVIEELKTLNQDGVLVITKFDSSTSSNDERRRLQMTDADKISGATTKRLPMDVIEIKIIPGGFTDEKDLGFKWQVSSFTPEQMKIQLLFDKPKSISSSPEKEEIEIYFKSEDAFFDQYGQVLSAETKLTKNLPAQVGDAGELEAMAQASATIGAGAQTAVVVNAMVNLTLSASLQYLWEMINAQQIVILLPLFQVNFPSNAQVIFDGIMLVASFELIPTDIIYEFFFASQELEEDEVNEKFASIGFEHNLLYNNFGTLGFMLLCAPVFYIFYYMAVKCRGIRCCRKVTNYLRPKLFWSTILRLLIESYIIGLLCCMINVQVLRVSSEYDRWTFANGILTLIFLPIFLVFPILAIRFMYSKFSKLNETACKSKYGEIYEGYNINDKSMLIYWGLDYLRKVLLVLVVVMLQDQYWLQMFTLFMSSVFLIICNGYTNARTNSYDRKMDRFNEIKLIILMYHLMLFTQFVPDVEMRFQIGYSCSTFLVVSTAVNMFMLFTAPIKLCQRKCRIKYHKKIAKKACIALKERNIAKGSRERGIQAEQERVAQIQKMIEEIQRSRAIFTQLEEQKMRYQQYHENHVETRKARQQRKMDAQMDGDDDESNQDVEEEKKGNQLLQEEAEKGDQFAQFNLDSDAARRQKAEEIHKKRVNRKRQYIMGDYDSDFIEQNDSSDDDKKKQNGDLVMIDTNTPAVAQNETYVVDQATGLDLPTYLDNSIAQAYQINRMSSEVGLSRIETSMPQFHGDDQRETLFEVMQRQQREQVIGNNYMENVELSLTSLELNQAIRQQQSSQQLNLMSQESDAAVNYDLGSGRRRGLPDKITQTPQKLSFNDLEFLWINYNLSVTDIEAIPGYENFEVTQTEQETNLNIGVKDMDGLFSQLNISKAILEPENESDLVRQLCSMQQLELTPSQKQPSENPPQSKKSLLSNHRAELGLEKGRQRTNNKVVPLDNIISDLELDRILIDSPRDRNAAAKQPEQEEKKKDEGHETVCTQIDDMFELV